jgi:predicted nucleotidyltransferase
VTILVEIPAELAGYLDELVGRLAWAVELEAVYLIGSAALGAYEHGNSDVDVIAITPGALADEEKRAIVAAAEAIPCPARTLELAVYARGRGRYEVNLVKDEFVSFDAAGDPSWWYVLERASADAHALPLVGPPWHEVFEPVPREAIHDAFDKALDWADEHEPMERSSLLNVCRGWCWLESGRWVTKPEAAAWLRAQVRAAAEAAR